MRRVVGFSFIAVALVLAVSGLFWMNSHDMIAFTGRASGGDVFLCINNPPTINFSCPHFINQSTSIEDNTVSCLINASDVDNESLVLSVEPDMPGNWTWISGNALWLRPFQREVGNQLLQVIVDDGSGCANGVVNKSYSLSVLDINDPPEYYVNMTNVQFASGRSLSPYSLYDFFRDVDHDTLNFSVIGNSIVSVSITQSTGLVYFSSSSCGTDYMIFRATDPFGLFDESSVVQVTVTCYQPPSDDGGGSSGGGGGSFSSCTPKWKCDPWSECLINGTRYKSCIDLNGCKVKDYKRTFWDNCTYVPTCNDGVQNQNETGIDCGGPCRPCGTCFDNVQNNDEEAVDCGGQYCEPCVNCSDGIMNWGEVGVDCGGPCEPCASCFDGIQNEGETGIDCGGPCPACVIGEGAAVIGQKSPLTLLIIIIAALIVTLIIVFRFYHKQIIAALARLGLYMTRKQHKELLLSIAEKNELLRQISVVEFAISRMEKPPSILIEELTHIMRSYFSFAFDMTTMFALDELAQHIESKVHHHSLGKILLSFFKDNLKLEQIAGERSYVECDLLIEELRLLIFHTSEASEEDMVHEASEKEIVGSVVEKFRSALFNLFLALEFDEITTAKKYYLLMVELYEHMSEQQKGAVFDTLQRCYYHVKYVLSWL